MAAAEQYQLELLKNICEERLCNSLEIGNSVSHLVLGDMYQVHNYFVPSSVWQNLEPDHIAPCTL